MPYLSLPNEKELLLLTTEGNRQAYSTLFRFYMPLVRDMVEGATNLCRQDVDEIVQLAFISIWDNREKICIVKSFSAYLSTTARNIHRARCRLKNKEVDIKEAVAKGRESLAGSTEDELQYKAYYTTAMEAVSQIPEIRRSIVRAKWFEGKSYKEAALTFSISEVAVKKQLMKGKSFVLDYLRRHGELMVLLFIKIFLK